MAENGTVRRFEGALGREISLFYEELEAWKHARNCVVGVIHAS